jgi:hypothetical protein
VYGEMTPELGEKAPELVECPTVLYTADMALQMLEMPGPNGDPNCGPGLTTPPGGLTPDNDRPRRPRRERPSDPPRERRPRRERRQRRERREKREGRERRERRKRG